MPEYDSIYMPKNEDILAKEAETMISSSKHQLALSGWLQKNDPNSYNRPLKLQKFLLFYDLMLKDDGEDIDTSHLKGYMRGPVYSNVWGDYSKERSSFDSRAREAYAANPSVIDEEKVLRADFLVKTMSEKELSDTTHMLNLWKCKQEEIEKRETQVSLNIKDYTEQDSDFVESITHAYSMDEIRNRRVIEVNDVYFLFREDDYEKLDAVQYDTLWQLSLTEKDKLFNPVFAEIEEDGAVLVDG